MFDDCKKRCSFLTELKMADLVPNKCDLNLKLNDRQVNILHVVSKVFERTI